MMDGDFEAVAGAQRQFRRLEHAFQQQNGPGDAGLAQGQRLLDAGHREGVGIQGPGDPNQTVTVALGLNGGRHPPARRGRPYPPEIVNQRPQIEAHRRCSTHSRNLSN